MSAVEEEVQASREAVDDRELAEVQKIALTGYDFDRVLHIVLRIRDGDDERHAARAFLSALLRSDLLTFGDRPRERSHAINVGFTFRGLRKLGLPERYSRELARKAPAFHEGAPPRAAKLGDSGESAAERWEPPFQTGNADVLACLFGKDDRALDEAARSLASLKGAAEAFDGWESSRLHGKHLTSDPRNRRVPFGFRDGLPGPVVACSLLKDGKPRHSAGEMLLGYRNDADFNHWADDRTPEEVAQFFRNGAFAILRKMQQHEDRFEAFLTKNARTLRERSIPGLPTREDRLVEYLKAKLCGRWPNGARIRPGQTEQPQDPTWDELRADSDFDFSDDPHAEGCPFGAHIRRASPRGDEVRPMRRRPLFRRGVPYASSTRDGNGRERLEVGLLGLFFCASIEDQFEHVLSEWVEKMPLGPPSRGSARDPIIGHHDGSGTTFHVPGQGAGLRLEGFDAPFVTTRGTLYALFPSRRALRDISAFVDAP